MYTWDPVQRIHSIGGIRGLAFSPDGKLLAVGGIGKIGNIDHLEGKARVEVFDWQKRQTHARVPATTSTRAIVEQARLPPARRLARGSRRCRRRLAVLHRSEEKRVVKEEKVKMHVHAIALNETADTLFAAGHGALAVFEMRG